MIIHKLFALSFVMLFLGILAIPAIPVYAQESENVVINELDINPPGSDNGGIIEWVELYNPTGSPVDISGWEIASTSILKKTLIVPDNTVIESEGLMVFFHQRIWFLDIDESVELRDQNSLVIDKTPVLSDTENDLNTWQRIFDGHDLDSPGDWKFATTTAGASNGEMAQAGEVALSSITVFTGEPSYTLGQTAVIHGTVPEEMYTDRYSFVAAPIQMLITGPNFEKIVVLYPDLNLNYSTTLDLREVLMVGPGLYEVTVTYVDQTATAEFAVLAPDAPVTVQMDAVSVTTDRLNYLPGQMVSITGTVSDIVKYKGVTFTVTDSAGRPVANGNIFPANGEFSTSVFISTVNSAYGTYTITVDYSNASASADFTVLQSADEISETSPSDTESVSGQEEQDITVVLDKEIYSLGDTMTVTGVIQDQIVEAIYNSGAGLKIYISKADGTPLAMRASQNTFNTDINGERLVGYDFTVLPESSGDYRSEIVLNPNIFSVGDYILTSQYFDHSSTMTFSVIDLLADIDDLAITLDRTVYGLNDTVSLSGIVPAIATPGVAISVTKPDGTIVDYGAPLNNQHFSWSWTTPVSERHQNIRDSDTQRSVLQSNFGIYKIKVSAENFDKEIFFKVSSDPGNDSFSPSPLSVSADKSLYRSGETLKVTGHVIPHAQGNEGLVAPLRVTVQVVDADLPRKIIYEAKVYPQQGGGFSSFFELPIGVFNDGTYLVKSSYDRLSAATTFSVVSDFTIGGDEAVSLLLLTDKEEYNPGDVVTITGKLNKLIHVETFDISVVKQTEDLVTCGTVFCGVHGGPVTSISPSPYVSFTHQFVIPDAVSAVGSYQATVDAGFGTESIMFRVVEEESAAADDLLPRTVIIKENRLVQSEIAVFTPPTTINGTDFAPRVLSGSLITPLQADQPNVNLKVSTADGLCVIGPDADCLVSESTQRPGAIYDTVDIDGIDFNVRYTGHDARLERFSILPESSGLFLPDMNWHVEILKDDQISRFYYKITYKAVQ